MLKKLLLLVAVLATFLATASPAFAQTGAPATYYVDTAYTGTQVGTDPAQPYNTLDQAVAAAQAYPNGGPIYTKQNGTYVYYGYIAPVGVPPTGMALSGPALFALLAVASLVLILGGWLLLRRSRTLARPV